ncbi:enoyl-CoA hydratase/isomerase family protein [Roseococcus sp. SYP-B2431]|uniref:enoyl-CoA hydratase/isomerase family protein n=1 Tax=Roseococcus sp. SYP-B2431 TaxID=2496640 RepID=UPI00103A3A03|nr:enoyl-CoA hydratase-related protein [Roseococcus sp. SYP-B2431]TCH97476.1 enoyl-CoA hydratase/isomerase family protein [Roseococcus sp. SYP-B2431]
MNDVTEAPVMRIAEERHGAVLVLTIDYPARRNALAVPLRQELEEAIERANTDRSIRCLVLTGAGGVFSAGGDISGMNIENPYDGRERMRRTHRLVRIMARSNLPIVAAVEGWAVGAGLSLMLLCDTVVAAENARFMAGFHKIGLMADMGMPATLPARIGVGRARDMLLHHTQYLGTEGKEIGLVDYVVPPGRALEVAMEKAQALAESAPLPIAFTRQWFAEDLDKALAREADFQATLFVTQDHKEGREAFLGKRKPAFTGK